MSRHRTHRKDASQDDIVLGLRGVGALVWPIGRPCDLLVFFRGRYVLLDCGRSKHSRARDAKQLENFAEWKVVVVADVDEALKAIGAT